MNNIMLINNENIGIGYVELNEADLLIYNKDNKYCFKAFIYYNWNDIKGLKIGEKKQIDFNEYTLSENNISALINPTISEVQKVNENKLLFQM